MKKLVTISMIGSMLASSAFAQAGDPLIEGAKQCTRHMPRYERQYGIPTHLLSAIASTESGRYHQGLKISIPWPWTINAEGKGYYFDSKQEAIVAARRLQASGVKSMDIGCMQVNLYHHPNAFSSLEEAFDPETNVAYAAGFLRGLYQESGVWKKAASDYHSKTPARGSEYVGLVYNSWYKIVDKLRAARVKTEGVPQESMMASNAPAEQYENAAPDAIVVAPNTIAQDNAYVKYVKPVVRSEEAAEAKPAQALPEQKGKKLAAYQSPRMNSIQVSTRRDDGIIVVKPSIRVVDTTEQVSPVIRVAQAPTENTIAVVPRPAAKKSGPNFIFND